MRRCIPLLALVFVPAATAFGQTTIYAGTDEGIRRSLDGGRNWQRLNDLRADVLIAGMRNDSRVLYAGTPSGLYRTTDGQRFSLTLAEADVTSVAVDSSDEQRLWVAAGGQLWRSADGGREWQVVPGAPKPVLAVATDPFSSYRLYVATRNREGSLAFSADRGETWAFLPQQTTLPALPDPTTPGRLYATPHILTQSVDYGQTWGWLGPTAADLTGVQPPEATWAEIQRFTALIADPFRPGDVHTCVDTLWVWMRDLLDPDSEWRTGERPGWATRIQGLWSSGPFPNEGRCAAVAREQQPDAALYGVGRILYRRAIGETRLSQVADLGSPIRALVVINSPRT
jgi:hypothetical protein